jgi:hypothetical protein
MYVVFPHDNDLYFFEGRTDVCRCPACKQLLTKWEEDLTVVPIKKFRKLDVGGSYDGIMVFSRRAKAIYEQAGMTGLRFMPLAHPDLFAIQANDIVQYDAHRRGTQFERKCAVCGRYDAVAGATPVYLTPDSTVAPLGFARTDVEFGSRDEKSPLFICGAEAAKILKEAKLKGLYLEKVKT